MILLSILAFLVIFSGLILMHEWGHFFAARKAKVKVLEFGLGLGKKVFGKKYGETEFTLNAIPFGGFVRMLGEESGSNHPRSFCRAALWKRMGITLAGVAVNFVFAILALTLLFSIGTNPILVSKSDFFAALEKGQIAIELEDKTVLKTPAELEQIEKGTPIRIIYLEKIQKNPAAALAFSITESGRISVAIIQKVSEIPGEIIRSHRLPEGLAGPVGIAEITHQVVPQGFLALLKLMALLSLSLAVMNLLPIPALDGGRFLFQLIELFLKPFGLSPSEKIENAAHLGGYFLLIGFILAVTWADIARIFFD